MLFTGLLPRHCLLRSSDFMNEIPRPVTNVMVDAANIFTEQAEADELGADKDKKQGKQRENAFTSPRRAVDNAQQHQQKTESDTAQGNDGTEKRQ